MVSKIDVLLTVQGSHVQNSLFMPHDAVIVEVAHCGASRVSFLRRYGPYFDSQRYIYFPVCDGLVVNSLAEPVEQNLTLCGDQLRQNTNSQRRFNRSLKVGERKARCGSDSVRD